MIFRAGLLGLACFTLFSCSDFLKGKSAKQENVLEIKQESISCLKQVSLDVKKFLKTESTNEEIDQTFSCLDSTLTQFQTRVEGRIEASAFTAEELFEIFDKFIKDANISKATAADLLLLKAAILGGDEQKITKTEIGSLREYLLVIKAEVKNLLPYIGLLSFKKTSDVLSKEKIRAGFLQLNVSFKNLLQSSKLAHSSYGYADLKRLVINLKLIESNQDEVLSLADKVNSVLIGAQVISSEEDRSIYVDSLTEAMRLYTLYIQGYVKFEISSAQQLNNLLEFIEGGAALLEGTLQFRKTSTIATETLDPILAEIVKQESFPLKIQLATALDFYKTILVRVFESGLPGDVSAFTGIKKIHFKNIERELEIFKIYSRFVAETTADKSIITFAEAQSRIKNQSIKVSEKFDASGAAIIAGAVEEFRSEFLSPVPAVYNKKRLVLANNQQNWQHTWGSLAYGLYIKMLSRLMILGWGNAPQVKEIKNSYLNKQGMVQWYSEFKKFGIEIKALDPRVDNAGAVSLMAANLFTRAGNGDDQMNFLETTQNIGILISSGSVNAAIREGTQKDCDMPEKDAFGNNWKNEGLFYANLVKNYQKYYFNLPYLRAYLAKHEPKEIQAFFEAVMDNSRKDAANKGIKVETADIGMMNNTLYFIESLFTTYDTDGTWKLSANEIRSAYPKFKDFATRFANKNSKSSLDDFNSWKGWIANFACYSEEDLIKESFVFLVYNGRTPTSNDLSFYPCAQNKPLMEFKGEVDRNMIINTFKMLKAILGS